MAEPIEAPGRIGRTYPLDKARSFRYLILKPAPMTRKPQRGNCVSLSSFIWAIVRRLLWWGGAIVVVVGICGAPHFSASANAGEPLAGSNSLPRLTSARAVRLLAPNEAAKGYPVLLRGVVTYHEPARYLTFIQDDTGGTYVAVDSGADRSSGLETGQLIEIQGITVPGRFAPSVAGLNGGKVKATVLGRAPPPPAVELLSSQLSDPRHHSQWVEVRGIVRGARAATSGEDAGRIILDVMTLNGRFRAIIPVGAGSAGAVEEYVDCEVRVRGVYGSIFNEKRQLIGMELFVPALREVEILRPAGAPSADRLPVRPLGGLMAFGGSDPVGHRVRVQGIVTLAQPDRSVFIRGEGGGLMIKAWQAATNLPGDVVDVVGFLATGDCNPILEDAAIKVTGHTTPPAPVAFDPQERLGALQDAELVSLEGILAEQARTAERRLLVIRAGGKTFTATIEERDSVAIPIPNESRVRVTGVCLVHVNESRAPESFRLLLRSSRDVALIRRARWWTRRRVVEFAGAAGLALAVVGAWSLLLARKNAALRREIRERQDAEAALQTAREELEARVASRTLQLSAANDALKKLIAERQLAESRLLAVQLQHLLEKERARIARDIHDDLGARLTQIKLLSELAENRSQDRAAVEAHARRIALIARETTRSMDEIVWAMDPRNDTLDSLTSYLCKFAQDYLGVAGIRCRLDAPAQWPELNLPTDRRHNLFLAFKEALHNVVKHAAASEVRIRFDFDGRELAITVDDDGHGVRGTRSNRPGAAGGNGNGLKNMRHRMAEIGGRFIIENRAGHGARVEIALELAAGESRCWSAVVANSGD